MGVSSPKKTAYFLFSRVNPKCGDYEVLTSTCDRIDAFLGYRTDCCRGRRLLKGFIVLRGPKTHVGDICRLFPNFVLSEVSQKFDFDFHSIPDDVVVRGEHPYHHVKKVLFQELSLTEFFLNGMRLSEG